MNALAWDDLERMTTVVARRRIADCPLAAEDHSARRGDRGDVVDVDTCNDVVFVEFRGPGSAIACVPEDLRP